MIEYECPWLIVNSASGSYSEKAVADVRAALCSGSSLDVKTLDCSSVDLPGAKELDQAGVRRLVVFSGDGTMSNYLGRLEKEGWEGAALPLPGGTKNLLCTDMHGTSSAADLAAMYARGELSETTRDCMRCGSLTALAEILAGPGARWADVREEMRDHEIGAALKDGIDIAEEAAQGVLVQLVDPPTEKGYPGLHFSLQEGAIEARGYPLETVRDWIGQGWAMATRDFREGPFDELGKMQIARCEVIGGDGSAKGMDLMVDGERETAGHRVEIGREVFGLAFLHRDER
ncbi:Diacylglycerol kinase catalytic domain-containing protein [Altererythrobacter xiamenensis]|uniref:Diacylglycerol kinase catalytic domain-containing protein n=1 Tax=Altererythrobacter xiamenensis TaxID=1316679 RepID=A0A1Y6EBZ2_9SPHN|nr:diacylglycerol kinase family protein [Altererythrobacter xiamenensis]SMQ60026.1 Diacylglycerol kinase catalytic domain-containing protein [Altererythrobacter xiamenensis]